MASGAVSMRNGSGRKRVFRHCPGIRRRTGGNAISPAGPEGTPQLQQQTAADHVAQGAVGLFPAQGFAQLARQLPTAAVGMRGDELP